MHDVIIIGGGLSGLSAATYLCNSGIKVLLLEAAPHTGGRVRSHFDSVFNTYLDNGQHIMMGCYENTFRFLKLIGAYNKLIFQPSLDVSFISESGKISTLHSAESFYPFNLLSGLLQFNILSLQERFSVIKFFTKLPFINTKKISALSAFELLKQSGQNERIISAIWETICVGALNADTSSASALLFVNVLKRIFLRGNFSSTIVLPGTDLSNLYCKDADDFIKKKGGSISCSTRVKEIIIENGSVSGIRLQNETISGFKSVISSVPPYSLGKILGGEMLNIPEFAFSPIVSAHIGLTKPYDEIHKRFFALSGSPVHWVFNHEQYLSTVTSGADEWLKLESSDVKEKIVAELEKYLPGFDKKSISGIKLIREKRATVLLESGSIGLRPKTETSIENLFLAGDWTDTGLPATIEGAVWSGVNAAKMVMKKLK